MVLDNKYKLQYGISITTGELLFVDDVPNGLACNCTCPECGCLLEARNLGEKRIHHFAHYTPEKQSHSRVLNGYGATCSANEETILHRAAKQIILQSINQAFTLPSSYFTMPGKTICVDEERTVIIDDAEAEIPHGDIIPDITLHAGDGSTVFVEIFVSHKIDKNKESKLRTIGIPCIEIDLKGIALEDRIPWQELKERLLGSNQYKKWVYTPLLARLNDKRDHFDKVQYDQFKGGYPCILMPSFKQDWFHRRCSKCPFFAGEHNGIVFCSASQLVNMNDIRMAEDDVLRLVEETKSKYIKDHNRDVWLQKSQMENLIWQIKNPSADDILLINAVWNRYISLPDEVKKLISNRSDLIKAKNTADRMLLEEENQRRITYVISQIDEVDLDRLPETFSLPEIQRKIENALNSYDELPEESKNKVTNRSTLLKAADTLCELKKRAKEQNDIKKVEKAINEITCKENPLYVISPDEALLIENAKELYDGLPDYIKKRVGNREHLYLLSKRLEDQRNRSTKQKQQFEIQKNEERENADYMDEYYQYLNDRIKYLRSVPAKTEYGPNSEPPYYYRFCRRKQICPICGKPLFQLSFFPKAKECTQGHYQEQYSLDEKTVTCIYIGPKMIDTEERLPIEEFVRLVGDGKRYHL